MLNGGRIRTLTFSALILFAVLGLAYQGVVAEVEQRLHPKLQRTLESLIQPSQEGLSVKLPAIGFSRQSPLGELSLLSALADERVQVVVEANGADTAALEARIRSLGGTVETTHEQWVQARVPLAALTELAALSEVAFIRQPVRSLNLTQQVELKFAQQRPVTSEGVSAIQAPAWRQAGLTGEGVKVGVVDTFAEFERLLGQELPQEENITTRSFATHGEMFSPFAPNPHGVGVSEVIHDIAPDAELFFTYFETDVEFRQAVDWLIQQDVDVVNTSLGFPSGCFEEGGGIFEPQFVRAKSEGVTWVTASGNEADIHWSGAFTDPDEDGLHNYRGSADEGNTLQVVLDEFVYPSGRRVAASIISGFFAWEAPCGTASEDYEVVVFRQDANGQLEELPEFNGEVGFVSDWMWRPGFPVVQFFASEDFDPSLIGRTVNYHVGIRKTRASAPDAMLDIQLSSCSAFCPAIQYVESSGSVSITEPSISSNVITVGASHHTPDGCPVSLCPQNPLLFYSSQGPTPFGTMKPEVIAPTHVSTSTFGAWTGDDNGSRFGFTGTSAASPHVAGAAALIMQAFPGYTQDEVVAFIQARAEDLGAPGPDNVFGAGALSLGQPPLVEQTAPLAPVNLTVFPSGWSNTPSFEVDWTSPSDGGQIVAAWYKIGQAPTGRSDGSRTTDKPLTITVTTEGEQMIYVWLEDSLGNTDAVNRAQARLRFDATPPTGLVSVNGGTSDTSSTAVTLSLVAQDQGGSGVAEVRLSNDGASFSDWETFADNLDWNLELISGTHTVFAQFRDRAGNVSEVVQDDIELTLANRITSGAPLAGRVEAQAASSQYMIDVPDGTAQLLIQARGAQGGDIDLYVRADHPVEFGEGGVVADFASMTPLSSEALTLSAPAPGTYYVAVVNRNAESAEFNLVVTLSPSQNADVQALSLGERVEGQAQAAAGDVRLSNAQFAVDVEGDTPALAVLLRSLGPGNLRLHVRLGSPVGWVNGQAVADWTSSSGSGVESIVLMGAARAPGRYYIAIENLEPYAQDYDLSVNDS